MKSGERDWQSKLEEPQDDPSLQKGNRQAVKNQGQATPDGYTERTETPV